MYKNKIETLGKKHDCRDISIYMSRSPSRTLCKMLVSILYVIALLHVSSASSVSDVSTSLASVQQEIVDVHNAFRRAVEPTASDMLKMSWSDTAAQSAEGWISQCNMTHGPPSSRTIDEHKSRYFDERWQPNSTGPHSPLLYGLKTTARYELGENLFKSSAVYQWSDVVSAWHSEVKNYEYPVGSTNGESIGHYTQVVWYSSYEVGCAVAQCGSYYFYGCHFFRAGNFKGVPPYSLGAPCAACPNNCEDNLCTNPCPYINQFINCDALKEEATCDNYYVNKWCPASCQCENEIIPIARK